MTDKNITNVRNVGGDYFRLMNVRSSPYKLYHFLTFNFEDYLCFKSTNTIRLIKDYQEFLDFQYSGYIFFKKDLYDLEHIQEWIKFCKIGGNGGIQYLNRPVPPFKPEKIIIKK